MTTQLRRATITSVGRFVPETVLSNRDLERIVDTSDDWIVGRTGICDTALADTGHELQTTLG